MDEDKRDEALEAEVSGAADKPLNLLDLVESCLDEVSFAGPCVGDDNVSAPQAPSFRSTKS
jgi:hypothetical protein